MFESLFDFLVNENDMIGLKVRGMPFETKLDQFKDFFTNHSFIEKSIIMGEGKYNRFNGFGAMLFEKEE